jgi:SAM-dependent methyltransferase
MSRIKAILSGRFPRTYRYASKVYRNALNHARWVAGRHWRERAAGEDVYSPEFWSAQEGFDYDGFARELIDRFRPASVLDVGCGSGNLLAAVTRVAPGVRVLGLENSGAGVESARRRGLPVRRLNIVTAPARALDEAARAVGRFDLTVCLEVAEHLPWWHAGRIVRLVAAPADTVVFSAAQPGQGGVLHLNEQPPEYWGARFARLGFGHDAAATTGLQDGLRRLPLPRWYQENVRVYRRGSAGV